MPSRVAQPPRCAYCAQVVEGVADNGEGRTYHGNCYRELHPPQGGPIHTQSHDDQVRDGLEKP
jgi:hypothetical protein